jgi:hypothetical protein
MFTCVRICSAASDGYSLNSAVSSFTTSPPPPTCPGALGANSVTIASLPYTTMGQTTCGSGNNVYCDEPWQLFAVAQTTTREKDRTYIFTAPYTAQYNILLTTVSDDDAGLVLYHGCPFTPGSTCEGSAQSTTGLTRTLTPTLTAGQDLLSSGG